MRTVSAWLLALIVSPLVGALACSSEEADPPPPSAAATAYATAYCERLDRCRTRASRDTFGDVQTCTGRFLPDIDDEFRSPGASITDAMVDTCAARMRGAPCDTLVSAMLECQFVGSLQAGAACGSGYQCQSSSCAKVTNGSGVSALCGTCSDRVPEGSDCTNANCQSGSVCAEGRCQVLADLDEPCEAQPCKPDLQCFQGRCERFLGPNDECTPETDGREVLRCDPTQLLFCAPTSVGSNDGRCVPVHHAPLGATCGFDATANALVACLGASCSAPLTATSGGGICVADLKEGAACTATDATCELPLYCIDGHCGRASIHACR